MVRAVSLAWVKTDIEEIIPRLTHWPKNVTVEDWDVIREPHSELCPPCSLRMTISQLPYTEAGMNYAWTEVETALPRHGWLADGQWVIPDESWSVYIEYVPASVDGVAEPSYKEAYYAGAEILGPASLRFVGNGADTPAGALMSLATVIVKWSGQ